jgi:hypothetical protein
MSGRGKPTSSERRARSFVNHKSRESKNLKMAKMKKIGIRNLEDKIHQTKRSTNIIDRVGARDRFCLLLPPLAVSSSPFVDSITLSILLLSAVFGQLTESPPPSGVLIDVEARVAGGDPYHAVRHGSRTENPLPYGLHMVAHGCACRPFTPPYPKGGAYGGAYGGVAESGADVFTRARQSRRSRRANFGPPRLGRLRCSIVVPVRP